MSTVIALVGGDGAGKTTIARELEASGDPVACRYLYMGQSVTSSDRALPTSRLARAAKERAAAAPAATDAAAPATPTPKPKTGKKKPRSKLRAAGSLANRIAEAAWRRLLIWRITRRGTVVVTDRHFSFEAAAYAGDRGTGGPAFDRFEYRVMGWLGRPDLVIMLDAPPEVLFARKGETSVRRLTKRRDNMLAEGERLTNFVRIDADRPYEAVLADVRGAIAAFLGRDTSPVARP
jgi:thymidylate kinase